MKILQHAILAVILKKTLRTIEAEKHWNNQLLHDILITITEVLVKKVYY